MLLRKATREDIPALASFMAKELAKAPFHARANRSSVLASLRYYLRVGEGWVNVDRTKIKGAVIYKVERYWEGWAVVVEDVVAENNQIQIENALLKKIDVIARKKGAVLVSFVTSKRAKRGHFMKMGYRPRTDLVILEKK